MSKSFIYSNAVLITLHAPVIAPPMALTTLKIVIKSPDPGKIILTAN